MVGVGDHILVIGRTINGRALMPKAAPPPPLSGDPDGWIAFRPPGVPAEPPLHVSPAAPLIADEREGDDDDEAHGDANGS